MRLNRVEGVGWVMVVKSGERWWMGDGGEEGWRMVDG